MGSPVNGRQTKGYTVDLAAIFEELRETGIVSRSAMARELNRRQIPAVRGGRWHLTTVQRVIASLGMLGNRGRGPEANARDADSRAEALGAKVTKLRAQGINTMKAMARELNALGIPGPRGGAWYPTTVHRLLKRLESIEGSQRSQAEQGVSPEGAPVSQAPALEGRSSSDSGGQNPALVDCDDA